MGYSLAGKTAIVTGAASGIGLAVAKHLSARDANVMFADMDEVTLRAEMGEAVSAQENVRLFAGDFTHKLDLANLVAATIDAFDRIDILINASRICELSDPLSPNADLVEEMWRQNTMTSLRLSQAVARRMIQAADKAESDNLTAGSIINMSSVAAIRVQPELLGYSMAMAAIEQMTRGLAVILAPRKIRVNAISIGSVMSATLRAVLKENPDLRTQIETRTPLGRIAGPDEVCEAVQYLASDASRFVTGQVLTIDGGRGLLDAVTAPVF